MCLFQWSENRSPVHRSCPDSICCRHSSTAIPSPSCRIRRNRTTFFRPSSNRNHCHFHNAHSHRNPRLPSSPEPLSVKQKTIHRAASFSLCVRNRFAFHSSFLYDCCDIKISPFILMVIGNVVKCSVGRNSYGNGRFHSRISFGYSHFCSSSAGNASGSFPPLAVSTW